MFVKFLFSRKKHCFIIFPYNVEIDFFNSLRSCYMSRLSEILSHYLDSQTFFHAFFHAFLICFPAHAAPSSMVLGRVFAKWRAVLFCTKSYYPLVGGTSPIPLNKLIAWRRNSYESLYFAVGIFFRNEKRGEPASIKPTDSPNRIIE